MINVTGGMVQEVRGRIIPMGGRGFDSHGRYDSGLDEDAVKLKITRSKWESTTIGMGEL